MKTGASEHKGKKIMLLCPSPVNNAHGQNAPAAFKTVIVGNYL